MHRTIHSADPVYGHAQQQPLVTSLVVEQFRSLALPARILALNQIFQSLTVNELRTFVTENLHYKFQRDIIADLPVELICLVFSHLDHTSTFRLQCVSKRWRHLLTTPEVRRSSLLSWLGADASALQYQLGTTGSDHSYLRARRIHAFSTFKPFSCSIQRSKYNLMPRRFAEGPRYETKRRNTRVFHEDTFAWTAPETPGSRRVEVINVVTGAHSIFQGFAKEEFGSIALTSQILGGLVSSGLCYVFDLNTSVVNTFRLPSGLWGPFAGHAGRLAVIADLSIPHAGVSNQGSVFLWNRDTLSTTSFPLPPSRASSDFAISCKPGGVPNFLHSAGVSSAPDINYCSIMLSSYAESVVVFSIHNRCHGRCGVSFTRYTSGGSVIDSGSHIFEAAIEDIHYFIVPTPMDNDGNFVVAYADVGKSQDHIVVIFDDRNSRLIERRYLGPQGEKPLFLGHDRPGPWLQWKNVAYWAPLIRDLHIMVYDPSTEPSSPKQSMSRSLTNVNLHEGDEQIPNRYVEGFRSNEQATQAWNQGTILDVLGNERFVILFRNRCIEVFSFEYGIHLPQLDLVAFPEYHCCRTKDLSLSMNVHNSKCASCEST